MDSDSEPIDASIAKRCTWCGAEYPDAVTACPVDAYPLTSIPAPPPGSAAAPRTRGRTPLFELWPSDMDVLGGVCMRSLMLACCLCYAAKIWAIEHRIAFPRGAEILGISCTFVLFVSSLYCIGWNSRYAVAGIVISTVGLLGLMLPVLAK